MELIDQFKRKIELNNPTTYFPLQVKSCLSCGFKQLGYVVEPKILYQEYVEPLILIMFFLALKTNLQKMYFSNISLSNVILLSYFTI